MNTVWAILRSSNFTSNTDEERENDSNLVGIYQNKNEAIEEIIKLYLDDDIDLFKPTKYSSVVKKMKRQRVKLKENMIHTYTGLGNRYSLIECVIDAKHDYEQNVTDLYNQTTIENN
uniref:Uncharacterized protein n=1 Tax=Pithovirus LCPAC302 TaxID=2506593 RepID=A0A481Z6F9_9VIRU|nr:MAG: hypothetical protein LCPAC302_00930 [Pithovirus LCPAC302]QBK91550.1 MAG: uncharacterized protein LCPAC302_01700 [Pithovirus LCPAC302]